MLYTVAEQKMIEQLEAERKCGMKNVVRSQEEIAIIESLQAKSHKERYGNEMYL